MSVCRLTAGGDAPHLEKQVRSTKSHEIIRPTHIEIESVGDANDEKSLYRLVRLRTLASQLEDAVFAVRTLALEGDVGGKQAVFEAKGKTLVAHS